MNDLETNRQGYVYILEVEDIDLPVCKIGMTGRNPYVRCSEINKSSTGDFLWSVTHFIAVDNCRSLESLIHSKLGPLRQKNREFFNLRTEDAYKAILSIIDSQDEIKIIEIEEPEVRQPTSLPAAKKQVRKPTRSRDIDSTYVELLHFFTTLLGVKGRPFGQLNRPSFGISDGNEGVQWNMSVSTDTEVVRVGVNLEGMKYQNWPIASFIKSELESQQIDAIRSKLINPEQVFVQFSRDAWQAASRPTIVERTLGGKVCSIAELDMDQWALTLTDALSCLSDANDHRGRAVQNVTVINKKNEHQVRQMSVSPHLRVWMQLPSEGDAQENLKNVIAELKPVYDWVMRQSST